MTPSHDSVRARAADLVAPFRDLYPFEHHFHDVPGGPLHYVDEGPRRARAVLALHGNPTWSFAWRQLIRGLSGSVRVIAPDHLGMGLSARPTRRIELAEHIDNVVSLVDALGLEEVDLVCHDWGGAIGFGAALARRRVFARFLVSNTAAFPSGRIPKRIAFCRTWLGSLAVRGVNAFAGPATRMTTVRPLPPRVRDAYLAPYRSWSDRRQVDGFVRDIPMETKHPSWATLCGIADRLEQLRGLPMTLLWGERDWCFDTVFRSQWEHRFPKARVRSLADVGHYVFEDAPDTLLQETLRLLGEPLHTDLPSRRSRWREENGEPEEDREGRP